MKLRKDGGSNTRYTTETKGRERKNVRRKAREGEREWRGMTR
jgi:hypothetical protein